MWVLIIASIQAIIQVMTVVIFGFILAKAGYFTMDKQKWLSKLNLMYFTPCLLFSNVASTISLDLFIGLWPIPTFYYTYSLVFYLMTQLLTSIIGLKASHRRFVLACVMFQNTNSLPLAIISSLSVSEAAKILFWDSDDTQEAVAARGTSYTLFFAIFGNILRWSYGYQLLQKHEGDDEHDENDQDHNHHSQSQVSITPSASSLYSSTSANNSANTLHPDINPERYPNSIDQAASGQGEHQHSIKHPQPVNETSSLLPTLPSHSHANTHQSQQYNNNTIYYRIKTSLQLAAIRLHSFMTPPLYAAILALIVGLSPLKQILYDKQSFLYPSFTKAIEMCGKAAVPIVLSCLGAQLASISAAQHSTPGIQKPVTAAVVIRMVLAPCLVIPLVILFVKFGSSYSSLATDPVFIVMMIVLGCTPTAINLIQISQVNGIFEEEMLHMLFWSYGVVCIPMVTLVVFLALNVVDRLL